jgi:hypothetical protein
MTFTTIAPVILSGLLLDNLSKFIFSVFEAAVVVAGLPAFLQNLVLNAL